MKEVHAFRTRLSTCSLYNAQEELLNEPPIRAHEVIAVSLQNDQCLDQALRLQHILGRYRVTIACCHAMLATIEW